MEWTEKLGHRGRAPWALLVGPGDQIQAFAGASVAGKVVVVGTTFKKNGKWSSTTFRLELAPGVRFLAGHSGWETGTWREAIGADDWVTCANRLGISLQVCRDFLSAWRPKAAEHYDRVESELGQLDDLDCDPNEMVISFGSPTRRQRDAGFWEGSVVVNLSGAEVGRVSPSPDGGWSRPVVTGGQVRVLDCTRTSGRGGGYVSLRLAVPEGSTVTHAVN
jgi:hypothetical protein